MGKLSFPKEKPEIAGKLEQAKKLISNCPDDAQVMLKAFNIITECAEQGSPRANFFKACLLYADEPETGEYRSEIIEALDLAIKCKYPLAYGTKIDYLTALDDYAGAFGVIKKSKGYPQGVYWEGGILAGYCEMPKGVKKNLEKACKCFEQSAQLYLGYENEFRKGCPELGDITVSFRNPYYFSEQAGFAYQMLMYVYSDMNVKANAQRYVTAYSNAQKYGNLLVKYKTACARATDSMNNVMGLYSLKTVNAAMESAKTAYSQFDEDRRQSLEESYDNLWEQYDEFYDNEMQRQEELGNMEVYTSSDYARQDSLLSDLAGAVRSWADTANTAVKQEHIVTIGNKTYKLNELGEMVDEYGQSNGLKVDVTNRKVYDSHSNAVGFFDSFGEFHKY